MKKTRQKSEITIDDIIEKMGEEKTLNFLSLLKNDNVGKIKNIILNLRK